MRVWDPDTGGQLAELTGRISSVRAVAVLPSPHGGHRIVSGGSDETVRVWDPDTGSQLAELTGHTSWVSAVAVLPSPDGRPRIVTGGGDRSVMIWASLAEEAASINVLSR